MEGTSGWGEEPCRAPSGSLPSGGAGGMGVPHRWPLVVAFLLGAWLLLAATADSAHADDAMRSAAAEQHGAAPWSHGGQPDDDGDDSGTSVAQPGRDAGSVPDEREGAERAVGEAAPALTEPSTIEPPPPDEPPAASEPATIDQPVTIDEPVTMDEPSGPVGMPPAQTVVADPVVPSLTGSQPAVVAATAPDPGALAAVGPAIIADPAGAAAADGAAQPITTSHLPVSDASSSSARPPAPPPRAGPLDASIRAGGTTPAVPSSTAGEPVRDPDAPPGAPPPPPDIPPGPPPAPTPSGTTATAATGASTCGPGHAERQQLLAAILAAGLPASLALAGARRAGEPPGHTVPGFSFPGDRPD